ncbi:hypothetical protein OH492_23320 [Vibrio chagasii]|nr:hypothetical protein [Vibrio chagasii]
MCVTLLAGHCVSGVARAGGSTYSLVSTKDSHMVIIEMNPRVSRFFCTSV